jgi:hypothetical protein
MPEDSTNQRPEPRTTLSWLRGILIKNITTIAGTLILGLLTLLWYKTKDYTQTLINNRADAYITALIEKGIDSNQQIKAKILDIVHQDRKFEAGATIAGSFTLTPFDRTYTLYIFCPPGHTPKLYYELSEFTKTRYVEAQSTNLARTKLKQASSIPLSACPSSKDEFSATPSLADENASEQSETDEIIAITFQLSGPEVDEVVKTKENPNNISIDVRYAAFVSPAIMIKK